MQNVECVFIGSVTKDIMMHVQEPPSSDNRISADLFITTLGGVSSTAGAAFKSLGGKTGLISATGDDESGIYIRSDLKKLNLEYLKLFLIKDSKSSTSMIQVEDNGKRCLTCYGGCIDKLTFNMIDKEIFHHTKILHLGVLNPETMLEICTYCKKNTRTKISIDSGNMSKELADSLLPFTDIFVLDDKTVQKTLGMKPFDACHYYSDKGAVISCITSGSNGAYLFYDKKEYHIPAPEVRVVDTTGAGDNFHGAFLYCLIKNWNPVDAVRFANIFASLSCEGMGGRDSIPSIKRVMEYYEKEIKNI